MKTLKNQKGITLVALVITIIVLLILAGVALSLVVGEGGILTRASSSSETQKAATVREQVELSIANLASDFYEEKYVKNNIESDETIAEYIAAECVKAGGSIAVPGGSYRAVEVSSYAALNPDSTLMLGRVAASADPSSGSSRFSADTTYVIEMTVENADGSSPKKYVGGIDDNGKWTDLIDLTDGQIATPNSGEK